MRGNHGARKKALNLSKRGATSHPAGLHSAKLRPKTKKAPQKHTRTETTSPSILLPRPYPSSTAPLEKERLYLQTTTATSARSSCNGVSNPGGPKMLTISANERKSLGSRGNPVGAKPWGRECEIRRHREGTFGGRCGSGDHRWGGSGILLAERRASAGDA